jgi:hypothetical protein
VVAAAEIIQDQPALVGQVAELADIPAVVEQPEQQQQILEAGQVEVAIIQTVQSVPEAQD